MDFASDPGPGRRVYARVDAPELRLLAASNDAAPRAARVDAPSCASVRGVRRHAPELRLGSRRATTRPRAAAPRLAACDAAPSGASARGSNDAAPLAACINGSELCPIAARDATPRGAPWLHAASRAARGERHASELRLVAASGALHAPSCASAHCERSHGKRRRAPRAARHAFELRPGSLRATTRPRTHRRATPPRCASTPASDHVARDDAAPLAALLGTLSCGSSRLPGCARTF